MSAPEVARALDVAMREQGGCCILYLHDGEQSARVIYPVSCRKSNGGTLSIRAWDSLRQDWRSFRMERILAAHPLRGPLIPSTTPSKTAGVAVR